MRKGLELIEDRDEKLTMPVIGRDIIVKGDNAIDPAVHYNPRSPTVVDYFPSIWKGLSNNGAWLIRDVARSLKDLDETSTQRVTVYHEELELLLCFVKVKTSLMCTGFAISVQQEEIQARMEIIASMMKEVVERIRFLYGPYDMAPQIKLSKCTLVIGQVTSGVTSYPRLDDCGTAPKLKLPEEIGSKQFMGMFLPAPANKNYRQCLVSENDAEDTADVLHFDGSAFIDLKEIGMVFLFYIEKNPGKQDILRCVLVAQDLERSVRDYSLQVSALVWGVYNRAGLESLTLGAVTFIWNKKMEPAKKRSKKSKT